MAGLELIGRNAFPRRVWVGHFTKGEFDAPNPQGFVRPRKTPQVGFECGEIFGARRARHASFEKCTLLRLAA